MPKYIKKDTPNNLHKSIYHTLFENRLSYNYMASLSHYNNMGNMEMKFSQLLKYEAKNSY